MGFKPLFCKMSDDFEAGDILLALLLPWSIDRSLIHMSHLTPAEHFCC